jgi:putative transcriptional regulator
MSDEDRVEITNYGEIILRVGEIAEERNLTATGLSDITGLSRPTCYDLIKGHNKRIQLDTLARLCYALKLPVNMILQYRSEDGENEKFAPIG